MLKKNRAANNALSGRSQPRFSRKPVTLRLSHPSNPGKITEGGHGMYTFGQLHTISTPNEPFVCRQPAADALLSVAVCLFLLQFLWLLARFIERPQRQLNAIARARLAQHAPQVRLHRHLINVQRRGNVAV